MPPPPPPVSGDGVVTEAIHGIANRFGPRVQRLTLNPFEPPPLQHQHLQVSPLGTQCRGFAPPVEGTALPHVLYPDKPAGEVLFPVLGELLRGLR